MSATLNLFIVNNVKFSKCKNLLDIVKTYKDDLYILCGGIGECLELLDVVKKCYGIPNVYDDEYIIKVLKEKKFFVGGRIAKVNSICIAGIDAKNPVQAIERILLSRPDGCQILIIISVYSLPTSRCAKINFKGKEISIGLPIDFSEKVVDLAKTVPTLIIVCQEYSESLCLDAIDKNTLYISIPKSIPVLRIFIDIQNLSIISMSYL